MSVIPFLTYIISFPRCLSSLRTSIFIS
uniref:Uncharacterized protein n=1 Tax=Arundo donax TaxID=35708 RepID=A0A0A8XWN4_ARUDO